MFPPGRGGGNNTGQEIRTGGFEEGSGEKTWESGQKG
jgi:hypothetical protein